MNHEVVIISEPGCHLNNRGLCGATDGPLCSAFISFVLISISILWTWYPLSVVRLGDWMASSKPPQRSPLLLWSSLGRMEEGGGQSVDVAHLCLSLRNTGTSAFLCRIDGFPSRWFDLLERLRGAEVSRLKRCHRCCSAWRRPSYLHVISRQMWIFVGINVSSLPRIY